MTDGAAPAPPRKAKALGRSAARGAAFSGLTQGTRIAVTMISTIVVARLLSPGDYGVIAMTTPITGFILLFQNMGLNQATAQARSITPQQINTLFFYNMAASSAIALAFILLAPVVGLFYGDPRPGYVMAASALTVLMTGAALQHSALLIREMRFKALTVAEMSGSIATLLTTIALALWLRSYWALWLGGFLGSMISRSLIWRVEKWRPSWPVDWKNAGEFVSFGKDLTKFNLINYLSRNLDNVLIARVWGPALLGLYDRSYKLMMFPLTNINFPLSRVMLPTLAKLRDEPARYRRAYLLTVRALAIVSVPGVLAATLCSHELVPLLLGKRWADAAPIFFWLGLTGMTQPILHTGGWLFQSTGRARAQYKWGMVAAPITIASFFAGIHWGPIGVATAYFISQMLLLPFSFSFSTRETPVTPRNVYAVLAPTVVAGVLTSLVNVLLLRGHLPALAVIGATLVTAYGLTLAAHACTAGGRLALAEWTRVANLPRRRAAR